MCDTRNFRKEHDAFLQRFPYRTAVIEGIKVRYQYGGNENAPVLLFFNGLEMQEMWMPYAEKLRGKYRFLIYEYPHHTASPEEQINFAANLLKKLSIEKVVLIGASDGGVYAQIFAKRRPELVQAMILTTTLTVASDLNYKKRFIHSFRCVYMLKDYQPFQANVFEYLRGEDTDPPPGANCFHGDAPHRRVLQRNGERE